MTIKRITPEEVKAAFEYTELKPGQGAYFNPERDCACGLGVMFAADYAETNSLGNVKGKNLTKLISDAGLDPTDYFNDRYGATYRIGFAHGFDQSPRRDFNSQANREVYDLGYEDGQAAYKVMLTAQTQLPEDITDRQVVIKEGASPAHGGKIGYVVTEIPPDEDTGERSFLIEWMDYESTGAVFLENEFSLYETPTEYKDSTGKAIHLGDTVLYRGDTGEVMINPFTQLPVIDSDCGMIGLDFAHAECTVLSEREIKLIEEVQDTIEKGGK